MDYREALAELKRILKEKSVTQEKVAEKLGVDRSLISKYLNGKRGIKLADLQAICEMAGVTIAYLFLSHGTSAKIYKLSESMTEDDRNAVLRLLSRSELTQRKSI